MQELICF